MSENVIKEDGRGVQDAVFVNDNVEWSIQGVLLTRHHFDVVEVGYRYQVSHHGEGEGT